MKTRIFAVAGNTLADLTRQRVFYFLLVFALLLIGSSVFLARLSFQQELQILKDVSLGAMTLFLSSLAILGTARLIPRDIEDRTVYTILAKPVRRFEYVLGKLIGVLSLLAMSAFLMTALFLIVIYMRQQTVLHETMREISAAPPGSIDDAWRAVHPSLLNADIFAGIAIIYLKAALLAALTLFVSTLATTNIFTVVVMVSVYFIGHLQAVAREYWLEAHATGWMTQTFLGTVALVFPDLQAFNVVDDIVAGAAIPLDLLTKTAALGVFYTTVYTSLAALVFSGKEL